MLKSIAKYTFFLLIISSLAFSCSKPAVKAPAVIPLPVDMALKGGAFTIGEKTTILLNPSNQQLKWIADGFRERIGKVAGLDLEVVNFEGKKETNAILLEVKASLQDSLGNEGYLLSVRKNGITITAAKPAGLFYGVQTVYQLLPTEIFSRSEPKDGVDLIVPCVEVSDKPSFPWRGMHLDVSRHFFPKEFIMKYIDLIALHKMNVFHWHLTDDNGWRIEIEKYPLLTEVAAWRVDRTGVSWTKREPAKEGEPATYGGYYTKEDIREIVEYASQRFVTIVPEIEMPGHSSEVFAAYPEYSCSGKKIPVQAGSYWPNNDIFCAGKNETFTFLENILDEVIELFPGPYIHIGGDEADKTHWKSCRQCQDRIRTEGLVNEEGLQGYFIRRIEKHISARGKRLVGWDEIMEGGLPPQAVVMSWRGFEGGIEAARLGHPVIMCPTSHCYFDYYQARPAFQPEAIGGLTTVKKVYSFHPVPEELSGRNASLVIGSQGNLWTEYISEPAHAEYMALPRMSALAEVLWTPKEKKDWGDFRKRLQTQYTRFDNMGVKYFPGSAKVEITPVFDLEDKPYAIRMETEAYGTKIFYTLDGKEPDAESFQYKGPIAVNRNTTLKAIAFKGKNKLENPSSYEIVVHGAIGKTIHYTMPYSDRYPGGGQIALLDGIKGSANYNDGHWQGFNGNNMDVVVVFEQEVGIKSVSVSFLRDQRKWIFFPENVSIYFSKDGRDFVRGAVLPNRLSQQEDIALSNSFSINIERPFFARYVRVVAENIGVCPDWHPGKGGKAWIFADEIAIN